MIKLKNIAEQVLYDMESDVVMGININDDEFPWTEKILSGEKTIETRNSPSLNSYINKRVGIIRTKRGKIALLVGYATIGEPIIYRDKKDFNKDVDKHLVSDDSIFKYNGTVKYGYPMIDVRKMKNPKAITSKGIVSRRII